MAMTMWMRRVRDWQYCGGIAMVLLTASVALGAGADDDAAARSKQALDFAVQLEDAFTTVVERAKPAVVVITNKRSRPSQQAQQMPPEWRFFFGLPFEGPQGAPNAPGRQGRPSRPVPAGRGSGVIIRDTGYIITNYHVIEEADALVVTLEDGRTFDNEIDTTAVQVVGVDKDTDLAVLQIGNGDLSGLPTLPFADSNKIRVGQWAIAIGAPFNLDYSVTIGHVSQKGRHDVGMTTFENYIQTDASINPGNSGGPLLNIHGEVIGINEFIVTGGGTSRGSIGLGFAISSNLSRQVADSLIEHGEVIRPFLGITMQPLTDELKRQFEVEHGVLVNQVMKGNPADKAGIEPGDVILSVGETPVRTPHDVQFAVLAYQPGDMIRLEIDRRGERKSVEVRARRRDNGEDLTAGIGDRQDILDQVGLALEETADGVFVSGVVSGAPAEYANLRRGDQILEVNRIAVKSIDEVVEAFKETRKNVAVLYVGRRGSKFFVGLSLKPGNERD